MSNSIEFVLNESSVSDIEFIEAGWVSGAGYFDVYVNDRDGNNILEVKALSYEYGVDASGSRVGVNVESDMHDDNIESVLAGMKGMSEIVSMGIDRDDISNALYDVYGNVEDVVDKMYGFDKVHADLSDKVDRVAVGVILCSACHDGDKSIEDVFDDARVTAKEMISEMEAEYETSLSM